MYKLLTSNIITAAVCFAHTKYKWVITQIKRVLTQIQTNKPNFFTFKKKSQLTNFKWHSYNRNENDISSCFYKRKKIFGRSKKREKMNSKKQSTMEKFVFKSPQYGLTPKFIRRVREQRRCLRNIFYQMDF